MNDITIQAFSLAQLVLDQLLSDDLEQAIHQVGHAVTEQESEAVTTIHNLVDNNGCLRKPYEVVYGNLQDHRHRLQQVNFNLHEISRSAAPHWKPVATSILLADNPRETARIITKRAIAQLNFRDTLNGLHAFWSTLVRMVQDLESEETAILRSLLHHPMTIEDLSHTLGLPLEHVQAIVASLWAAGAIDLNKGSLLHRLFPSHKTESQAKKEIDPGDYFTITMRGHFRLRPLVKLAEPQGVV